MEKSSVTETAFVIIVIACIASGFVSALYFGPDNKIEKIAEDVAEYEIEKEAHVPPGTLKEEVDLFFPHKESTPEK
jgi:Na+-translocating ferredoxin:NAD+ oxidoreductase RnfG subunit